MLYPSEENPYRALRLTGCLVAAFALVTVCLLPILFVEFAQRALTNLSLSPAAAISVLIGMIIGSLVNIPIKRMPSEHEVEVPMLQWGGGWPVFPQYRRLRQELVVAVNVGGCVIPVLLALWLLPLVTAAGRMPQTVLAVGILVNAAVCYATARPIPQVGIALPFFLPAVVALSVTWLGLGGAAYAPLRPPVAFIIGITGPLLGADLLHWRDFKKIAVGTVSIGGAGTWDGIVLSGLLAALFA